MDPLTIFSLVTGFCSKHAKLIKLACIVLAVAAVVFLIHHAGAVGGAKSVQMKWDAAKVEQGKQIAALQKQLSVREDLHRQETAQITDQLRKTEADHETSIAVLRSDTAHRLLDSERRASTYRDLAQGGSVTCGDLAGHAAEFDRALEEGRSLVVEFGSTVRFRDSQIEALAGVITNDRKLLGGH